jgi:hypothetical protein
MKASSAVRNSGQKPELSERDRCTLKRIVSKNHSTAAKVTQNSIFILKTLFPHKQSDDSFTNPTPTVEMQLPNL